MRKNNLLISVLVSTFIASCNSGGGTSSSNGGSSNNNISQPQEYSAQLPSGGNLMATTNLYLSANSNNIPLQFGVQNLTADTTVTFTVQPTNSNSASSQSASLPSISPTQCVFNVTNPQPCTIIIDTSVAPVGSYRLIPATTENLTPITFTTMTQASFTLPDGTYQSSEYRVNPNCQLTHINETYTVTGGQLCSAVFGECQANQEIPIPSGNNPFKGHDGYLLNVAWTGNVATLNWNPEGCPATLASTTLTKVSNSVSSIITTASPLSDISMFFSRQ